MLCLTCRLQSKTTTPKCIQGLPPKSALKIFLPVVGDQLGSWSWLMVADCISTKLSFLAAVLLLPSFWQTGYENNLAYSPLLNSPKKIEQTLSPFSLNIIKKKRNGHLPEFPEFSGYNGLSSVHRQRDSLHQCFYLKFYFSLISFFFLKSRFVWFWRIFFLPLISSCQENH